jgi:Mg-chelatase subunit ChlD
MRYEISVRAKNELSKRDDGASLVILADTSGSMEGEKIERLKRSLNDIWKERPGARLMAFSSTLAWCDGPYDLPPAYGGTDMDRALEAAALVWPGEVLVISDGLPGNQARTLEAARQIPGTISTLFVGDDEDQEGAEFLRKLAALGGGEYCHKDLSKHPSIVSELRSLLALPAPITMGKK